MRGACLEPQCNARRSAHARNPRAAGLAISAHICCLRAARCHFLDARLHINQYHTLHHLFFCTSFGYAAMAKTKLRAAARSPRALRARRRDRSQIDPDVETERISRQMARDLQESQSSGALKLIAAIEALGDQQPGMDLVALFLSSSRTYYWAGLYGQAAGQEHVASALTRDIVKGLSQAKGITDAARRMYEDPKLKDDVSRALADLLATARQRGIIGRKLAKDLTQLWSDMQKKKRGEYTTCPSFHARLLSAALHVGPREHALYVLYVLNHCVFGHCSPSYVDTFNCILFATAT